MRRWNRLASKSVLEDRWFKVTADRCEIRPGKIVEPFYVVHEKEWVHVYAMNGKAEILTVRQYRYAADAVCTELPGGVVESGEDHRAAAMRELLEETGHTAQRWTYVGKLFANPARQTNSIHLYLAEDLSHAAEQHLDESEDISWMFQTPQQIQAAVGSGEFSQALHVASLYRAQEFLRGRSGA